MQVNIINLAATENLNITNLITAMEYAVPEGTAMVVTLVQVGLQERMDAHRGSCTCPPSVEWKFSP